MQKKIEMLNTLYINWRAKQLPVTTQPDVDQVRQRVPLELGLDGASESMLFDALQSYLEMNPDVSHRDFNKLLYSGMNPIAVLGDWVTSLSNATMHTYQMGPVASLMEIEIITAFSQIFGLPHSDGTMVSGGSQANMIGLMLARQKFYPEIQSRGMQGKQLLIFTSDQSHYSMQKAAVVMGFGTDNLIKVASDETGRIIPEALEFEIQKAIDANKHPLMISATAGTTVLGAFDDFTALREIALKHNLWLHVDAAWGGAVVFSEKHRHLVKGMERADSIALDAHKILNVPITAGIILCSHDNLLAEAVGGGGESYLFHKDQNSDYNLGAKSLQCGRRADALKVWISWKEKGSRGFGEKIDYLMQLKKSFVEEIHQQPKFELLGPSEYLNVLFRYVPSAKMQTEQLNELNSQICRELAANGTAFVDYASFKGRTGARLIIANETSTSERLKEVLHAYAELGETINSR